jgi:hypothetical protein
MRQCGQLAPRHCRRRDWRASHSARFSGDDESLCAGHDARFYDNPEEFDPMRWLPEEQAQAPQVLLLSIWRRATPMHRRSVFVDGRRAYSATLAQRFRLKLAPNHPPVEPQPVVTIRPRHGLSMILEKREVAVLQH